MNKTLQMLALTGLVTLLLSASAAAQSRSQPQPARSTKAAISNGAERIVRQQLERRGYVTFPTPRWVPPVLKPVVPLITAARKAR